MVGVNRMSVDYDLACHKCKERVSICSDGFSGPLMQSDKSLAAFTIHHRNCALSVISESVEDFDDYRWWDLANWKDTFSYEIK